MAATKGWRSSGFLYLRPQKEVSTNTMSVNPTFCCVLKQYQAQNKHLDLLVVFDKLVEAEQYAQPSCAVVWLQVEADLVHDGRPLAWVVLLDHVVDACCQLDPADIKKGH